MGEKTLRRCWRFWKKPALHNVIFFYCIIFKRDKELCAVFGLKTSLYLHIMQCLSEAPSAVFAHTGKNLFHLQPKPVTHCWPTKAVTSNRPQEANTWQNSISKYCNTFSLNVSHNFFILLFFLCTVWKLPKCLKGKFSCNVFINMYCDFSPLFYSFRFVYCSYAFCDFTNLQWLKTYF